MSYLKGTLKGELPGVEVSVRARHAAVGNVKQFAFGTDVSSRRMITDVDVIALIKFHPLNVLFNVTRVIVELHFSSCPLLSKSMSFSCKTKHGCFLDASG